MDLAALISEKYPEFIEICRTHQVDKMYAFGSSITDRFDPQTSDIDIVVEVDIAEPTEAMRCYLFGIVLKSCLREK